MDAKRSVVGPNHKKNAIVRDKGIVKCGKVNVSTLTWENRSKKSMSQSAMSFGVDTNKELKDRACVSGSKGPAVSAKSQEKKSYPSICDLCPEDKRRVKELIEQVARLGCEKENLEGEMVKERSAYQGLLETLKTQYHEMAGKKSNLEAELKSLHQLPPLPSDDPATTSSFNQTSHLNPQSRQLHYPQSSIPHSRNQILETSKSSLQTCRQTRSKLPADYSRISSLHLDRQRPVILPSSSSSTFTDVQLSPSRHFRKNLTATRSTSIPRSGKIMPSLHYKATHSSHCRTSPVKNTRWSGVCMTSSPLAGSGSCQVPLGDQTGLHAKQRARLPSGMSTISSVSVMTDEDASSSDYQFLPQHADSSEKTEVGATTQTANKQAWTKRSGGIATEKEKELVSADMVFPRPSSSPGGNILCQSSEVPPPPRSSCIDSSTQTLNVESKAIQTVGQTPLESDRDGHASLSYGTGRRSSAEDSTFMPSAYVTPYDTSVRVGCDGGGHCSSQYLTSKGSGSSCQHHCHIANEEPRCMSRGAHHCSMEQHQKLHHGGSDVLQDCQGSLHPSSNVRTASSSSSAGHCGDYALVYTPPASYPGTGTTHDTARQLTALSPLVVSLSSPGTNAAVISTPTNRGLPASTGPGGGIQPVCSSSSSSYKTRGSDFSTAGDSSKELEQDMWLASSLLNGHIISDAEMTTSCQSNLGSLMPSHGGPVRIAKQPVDTSPPPMNSSFDIAFSLNCDQDTMVTGTSPSGTGHQSPPVHIHISSAPPTTTSPLLKHKPHLSQAGRKEVPPFRNGEESRSLNASYEATDETEGGVVIGGCSGGHEESLMDNLFFIQ